MRVLFTVSDWPGHYFPMVPLGWALQSAGHDVRVVCTEGQEEQLSRAGLIPVPLLGGLDQTTQTRLFFYFEALAGRRPYPGLPLHPVTGEELDSLDDFDFRTWMGENKREIAGAVLQNHANTLDFAERWQPDLVVHDPLAVEGLLAAKVTGVPAVLHPWGPVGTHEPDPALKLIPDDPGGVFPRHGAGELGPGLVEYVIDAMPEPLRAPTRATRLPVRYLPYNGPGSPAPALPRPSALRRVCVIWSSSLTRMFGPRSFIVPQIIAAAAGPDTEVVFTGTAHDVATLGELPPGVQVVTQVPLQLLLPGCSAVVHHGGAGCTMTALDAGLPQLALTFAPEQQANGERIAAAGAGAHLQGHLAGTEEIRAALAALLDDPAYQRSASSLRELSHQRPSPAELVRQLADLAARHSRSRTAAKADGAVLAR